MTQIMEMNLCNLRNLWTRSSVATCGCQKPPCSHV